MLRPTISIWTSSHDWNGGFRKKIKQVFKEKSDRFQKPVVVSKPSLKMSYNIARKILKYVQAQSPNPQVHVIMLGDNNLRWFHNQPEDVLAMFRFLMAKSSKIQNCKIVITSLIPTLENIEENFQTFVNFDKELAKILTSISQAFSKLLTRPRRGLDQFIAKYGKFEKFDFPIPQFIKIMDLEFYSQLKMLSSFNIQKSSSTSY